MSKENINDFMKALLNFVEIASKLSPEEQKYIWEIYQAHEHLNNAEKLAKEVKQDD